MKNRETERKFLVTSTEWKRNSEGVLYRQGYLSTEPGRTVRVRLEGNRGKLTIKGKKKVVREMNMSMIFPAMMQLI